MKVPADTSVQAVTPADPARNGSAGTSSAANRTAATAAITCRPAGVGWLIAALVLVALTIVVFAGGLRREWPSM